MVRVLLWLCLAFLAFEVAAQDDTLNIELVFDPRDEPAFEGEMVLATIRGVYRETITNEDLKFRRMTDFDWTRLGHDRWREERVDGRMARVMERRIALFPKRAGRLEILPIVHELEILGAGGQREVRLIRSDPVTVEVRPRPATQGAAWLPVRALELSDHWSTDPAALEDGELVERRVILRAFGATPEMMPEQPPLREPWLITFSPPETINMEITPQGPVTTVEWRWKLRPITGEPGVIPEVLVPYYDTTLRHAATAIIPASPIGYASFADNAASGWQGNLGPAGPHLLAFASAFLIGVTLSLLRRRVFSNPLKCVVGKVREKLLGARLGWLLRRGRLTDYRREAALRLRMSGVRADKREELFSILDATVYGQQRPPGARQLRELDRSVRRVLRIR